MDHLLEKIRDLEKEADRLVKEQHQQQQLYEINKLVKQQQKGRAKVSSVSEEVQSFAHWVQSLRTKAGGWTAGPLVVLSLFDGIGGIWTALTLLGIPFVGYSCEVNSPANQVVKARYPMVHHLGDVSALEVTAVPEKVDLVVGGFPCQDLSSLGHRFGLHGQRSKLFFEMLRIIKMFKPTWFLAENVASMAWQDRDEISKHLNTIPIEIDSQDLTPNRRRRLYWSNIPYPKKLPQLKHHVSTSLQSVLKDALALDSKVGCILSCNVRRGGHGALDLVMDNSTCGLRYISVTEVEKAMGYPAGYTDVKFRPCDKNVFLSEQVTRIAKKNKQPEKRTVQTQKELSTPTADGVNRHIRWSLLGNTFSVNVIAYLLSPLLERTSRAILRPIVLPKSIAEEACSAMDPGEVWALYNSHERPNWYALIASRTGDRFSSTVGARKKKAPLHIEVRFMELTDPYAAEEADEWDTVRGTGLFQVRPVIDYQNSWVAFSHRIDNYWKFDELYFIFPAKDEVWAVYDNRTHSRYLVYVMESYVDQNKAKQGKPGKECFIARCRLLQRLEPELYRFLDKEIDYTELALFTFKAPYIFKDAGSLLKIDLTTRTRRERSKKRQQIDLDSEFGDEDVFEEDAALAEVMGADSIALLENDKNPNSPPASGSSR